MTRREGLDHLAMAGTELATRESAEPRVLDGRFPRSTVELSSRHRAVDTADQPAPCQGGGEADPCWRGVPKNCPRNSAPHQSHLCACTS
jgi:hypothetical protein